MVKKKRQRPAYHGSVPSEKPFLSFVIEPEFLQQIDDWQKANGFATRAAAIKWLLRAGLRLQLDPIGDAVLQIIESRPHQRHQDSMGGWTSHVRDLGVEVNNESLTRSLLKLRNAGLVRLSQPDAVRYEANVIDGTDAKALYVGVFNVVRIPTAPEAFKGKRSRKTH